MEDKQDNLGKFIWEKLNQFESDSDVWDKPDAEIWQNTQQHLNFAETKRRRFPWAILLFILTVLFFSVLVYYLLQSQEQLKEQVALQKLEQNRLMAQNEILENQVEELSSTFAKVETRLEQKIKVLTKENELLKEKSMLKISNELAGIVPKQDTLQKEEQGTSQTATAFTRMETARLESLPVLLRPDSLAAIEARLEEILLPPSPIGVLDNRSSSSFKLGYSMGFQNLKIPVLGAFEEKTNALTDFENVVTISPVQGFHFSWSPNNRFFLKSGIRRSNLEIGRSWKFVEKYDDSKEVEQSDGSISNALAFSFRTPYNSAESTIDIEIPEDANIEAEEFYVSTIFETQAVEYFQIPLGVVYNFGKNRLQGQLELGVQWNSMQFRDYSIASIVETDKTELPIRKIEVFEQELGKSTQFFSNHFGFGLNYSLHTKWELQTSLIYHYNWLGVDSKVFSRSDLFTRDIQFGLNYRF